MQQHCCVSYCTMSQEYMYATGTRVNVYFLFMQYDIVTAMTVDFFASYFIIVNETYLYVQRTYSLQINLRYWHL